MSKDVKFLSKGLFEKDFMQTKVKTRSMTTKEKILGYILGPGLVILATSIVDHLREMFYTDVIQMDTIFGTGTYAVLQTSSTILGICSGLLVGYLTSRTVSKAGRFRPYVLIGSLLMILTGFFIFYSPFLADGVNSHGDASGAIILNKTGYLIWTYIFNFLFYGVGTGLHNTYLSVVAMSTRSIRDRDNVTTLRQTIVMNMITGVVIAVAIMGMIFTKTLEITSYYEDGTSFIAPYTKWLIFIAVFIPTAIIGALIEYFWTRERITEDVRNIAEAKEEENIATPSIGYQIKCLLKDKYFLISLIFLALGVFVTYLQGANCRQYFCQYVLAPANPQMDQSNITTLYLVIAMQPMAIGAFLVPYLAKKHGVRIITLICAICSVVGIAICSINFGSFAMACAGGFIFSFGQVAISFMSGVFAQQAADHVEYKYGFRPEGLLGFAILTFIYSIVLSPFSSIFETVLVNYTDYTALINGVLGANATPVMSAQNWILIAYYGAYALQAIVYVISMIFFDIEKVYPAIQQELLNRRIKAASDKGETYVSEEEQAKLALANSDIQAEMDRIADLKDLCVAKGLDFETENAKYLAKLEAKKAKQNKKKK